MANPLIILIFVPAAIAVSMSIVALYLMVARRVMPLPKYRGTVDLLTPLQQFDGWPGGRTKISFEGDQMVRTRVKEDPTSGIAFQVREVA